MSKIYDWMAKHPHAARIWIIAICITIIALLTVPTVIYIPGFLENIKYLHRQNPTLFFLFVVTPGVITTACSTIWVIGSNWEKLGDALNIPKDEAADCPGAIGD